MVEDDSRIAGLLEKGLARHGYATTVVDDGRVACAVARDDSFDLLILDIGLPGMDGLDVLRELRRRGDRLPTIIVSASEKVEGHGADDFLPKPFRFAELLARIRELLG